LSTESTLTLDGQAERSPRTKRPTSWLAVSTLVLAVLAVPSFASAVVLWLRGAGRSSEAVDRVVAEARSYRDAWAKEQATANPGGKKKGRKKKAAKPSAFAVAPLPAEDVPLAEIEAQNKEIAAKIAGLFPKDLYIVIDTANNRFFMKKGQDILMDAVCSTGSYSRLDAPDGRSWFFHTPRGLFKVQGKMKDPVWVKPDWAFVEEQQPIPGPRHPDRYEPYVMGDYALSFGDGYYIHGTLYRRLLGQSVTHGCVRLGDKELERVFQTASVGTPVFIY
jgi:lipoprotein-anchoring transpeptidase ErfK/SrfK